MRPLLVIALFAAVFGILVFGSLNALSFAAQRRNPTPQPTVAAGCQVAGCSSQLCVDRGVGAFSNCEFREEYACYRSARCERQSNGQCGWTPTAQLTQCLEQFAEPSPTP